MGIPIGKVRTTMYLDKEVHRAAHVRASFNGVSVSEIVNEYLRAYSAIAATTTQQMEAQSYSSMGTVWRN